jgi:hypothetical protein
MKNIHLSVSKIIALVFVIVCIVLIGWGIRSHSSRSIVTYIDPGAGISISHPYYLKLTPVPTEKKAMLFYLDAPGSHAAFVGFMKDHDYVERDRRFYDGVLFKEPNQTVNSRVSFGDYTGYKAVVDVNVYRYTLYRNINASSSLIIRSEISASSSPSSSRLRPPLFMSRFNE